MQNNKINISSYSNENFCKLIDNLRQDIVEINCDELCQLQRLNSPEQIAIIDVREPHEVIYGTIPNAIALSKGILERDIEKKIIDRMTPIVVYCAVGARSVISAYMLRKMGYKSVYSLKGGFNEWLKCQNLKN